MYLIVVAADFLFNLHGYETQAFVGGFCSLTFPYQSRYRQGLLFNFVLTVWRTGSAASFTFPAFSPKKKMP